MNTEQPFGYRDIYQTPSSILYQALPQQGLPPSGRHFDWQLWGEDVTPQLKTIKPWEEQPASLTQHYGLDDFPLLLPSSDPAVTPAKKAQTQATRPNVAQAQHTQSSTESFQVTDIERGHHLREHSYAHPLDVQMNRTIPINAPPVDALLNLRQDSVPTVSLSVLTPTEARRLQKDHYDLRNLILSRTQRCPYDSCGATFPITNQAAIRQHLTEVHTAEKCDACNRRLHGHWSDKKRHKHLISKHPEVVKTLDSTRWDNYGWRAPPAPEKQPDQTTGSRNQATGSNNTQAAGSSRSNKRKETQPPAKTPPPKRSVRIIT